MNGSCDVDEGSNGLVAALDDLIIQKCNTPSKSSSAFYASVYAH